MMDSIIIIEELKKYIQENILSGDVKIEIGRAHV